MNPPDEKWQERARGLLKSELARRGITYRQLAERLQEVGWKDNERNIANKMGRAFTAAFFIACLDAIDCRVLRLKEDD